MIDYEQLAQVATRDPRVHAHGRLGTEGSAMVGRLINRVRAIYRVLSPEQLTGGITVLEPLSVQDEPSCLTVLTGRDLDCVDELPDHFRECVTIMPRPGGSLRASADLLAPADASETEAVYHFRPDLGETIQVAGRSFTPDNPAGMLSVFAIPTFESLEKALRRYSTDFARFGVIGELRTIWRDGCRIMFHEAPEETMRRSLEAFLVSALREVREIDIRPETPVDESHPVDLRIVFTHTNRVALIEIKWMGDSADSAGGSHVKYRDARALEGATQLADYLEADRPRSTGHVVVGYLVVYDARRKGITTAATSIDANNGMHYADKDVEFQPEILARSDFARPLRMFMEPVCQ